MNIILPLILLLIANLVLYWVFFGKGKFEKNISDQINMKKNFNRNNSEKELDERGFNKAELFNQQFEIGGKR